MGISVFPAAGGGASVSDGNTAGWNLGAEQIELISEYTTTTFVTSITISSIPQTYRKLIIQFNGLEPSASLSAKLRMNGDTTGHAELGFVRVNSTTGETQITNLPASNNGFGIGADPSAAGLMSGTIEIDNYTSTAAKIGRGVSTYFNSSTWGTTINKTFLNLVYRTGSTTPAVTSVVFATGTSATLAISGSLSQGIRIYGVK
jgi:hypothetical protein